MKALSIQQPWAHAILHWGKDVENRTWSTNFRGEFFIHASKEFDHHGWDWIRTHIRIPHFDTVMRPEDFDRGGIVGTARLVDVCSEWIYASIETNPWYSGPYGFVLHGAVKRPFIPLRGMLGFFETGIITVGDDES